MVGYEGRINRFTGVVIRVCPAAKEWKVSEAAPRAQKHAPAAFKTKSEALSYAMSLAETMTRAVVEVYGESGALEARSAYRSRPLNEIGSN